MSEERLMDLYQSYSFLLVFLVLVTKFRFIETMLHSHSIIFIYRSISSTGFPFPPSPHQHPYPMYSSGFLPISHETMAKKSSEPRFASILLFSPAEHKIQGEYFMCSYSPKAGFTDMSKCTVKVDYYLIFSYTEPRWYCFLHCCNKYCDLPGIQFRSKINACSTLKDSGHFYLKVN